jgi:hypothetical protein
MHQKGIIMNGWKIGFFVCLIVLVISNFFWVVRLGLSITESYDLMDAQYELRMKNGTLQILNNLFTNCGLTKNYDEFIIAFNEQYKDSFFTEQVSTSTNIIRMDALELEFENKRLKRIGY